MRIHFHMQGRVYDPVQFVMQRNKAAANQLEMAQRSRKNNATPSAKHKGQGKTECTREKKKENSQHFLEIYPVNQELVLFESTFIQFLRKV